MVWKGETMAFNLLTYSGIVTKSRAMQSHLMNQNQYTQIANLDSVTDFITYLKGTKGFHSIFQNCDENELHRSEIEHLLVNGLYESFSKLYRFANQKQRNVLRLTFFRYEVNILKLCLQNVFDEDDDDLEIDLSMFESFFLSHSDIKVTELAASKTIDEFINHLQGTEFYALFNKLKQSDHKTLHDYEVQLDIYYFSRAWKMKDSLKGQDKKALTQSLGSEIDLLNILWIYRSKKFYDIDSTKVLANIIPITYKLSKNDLKKLIEAITLDDFTRILHTTYYHSMYGQGEEDSMETYFKKVKSKITAANAAKYSSSMAPIIHFLYLKEQELDRLTTALECIRYRLEPSTSLKYILEQ